MGPGEALALKEGKQPAMDGGRGGFPIAPRARAPGFLLILDTSHLDV